MRYQTPLVTQQVGKGLAEDLIKLAEPLIVQQAQAGLQDIQRGKSAADTWADRSAQLSRGLKRKAPDMAWTIGKNKAKRTAQNTYKRATQRVRDIFGQDGTCRGLSQNAKSYSTATRPWTFHLAVSSRGHDFWQVDHGALSLDAHDLPPVGPLAVGSTPTTQDERGHEFWQGGSPEGVVGQPSQSQEAERGQPLQQVEKTHPNRFSSPPLSIRSSHP